MRFTRRDKIADAIEKEIETWKLQSFEAYLLHVLIQPAPHRNQICNGDGQFVGFDRYLIDVFNGEMSEALVRQNKKGRIMLGYGGRWYTISNYLACLQPPRQTSHWFSSPEHLDQYFRQPLWDKQWEWWHARSQSLKKHFHFRKLPSELRELIYTFTCETKARPYQFSKFRRGGVAHAASQNPMMALFLVNRTIFHEASHIFFKRTTFQVDHPSVLKKLIRNNTLFSLVTSLELALSHMKFMELFQYDDGILVSYSLRHMPSIRTLTLDFEAPQPASSIPSFWGQGVLACQDTIVEWILTAAIPHVAVIQNVRITGYAKIKQIVTFKTKCEVERKKFNKFCELTGETEVKEYDAWNEDDGGVRLCVDEGEQGKSESESKNELLWPPECHCEVRCALETWTPE